MRQSPLTWVSLVCLLAALFLIDLFAGSVRIPIPDILKILVEGPGDDSIHGNIIWEFRMTKALTCVLAGSALSLAGLQMQTLFRNPLAGPDVLGLSSGAGLAVSLVLLGAAGNFVIAQSPWIIAATASAGSIAVFLIMLVLAQRLRDNASLLLVGLMIGAGTSSVVSVLQYLAQAEEMQVYILWTFGSLGGLNWQEITVLLAILAAGIVAAAFNVKALNAWMLGENNARSIGINVKRARTWMILSAGILTGGVTAFCGPIAFVGLAVPHLVRIFVAGADHRKMIPAVLAGGASLMLCCDIIAQLPGDYVLPVNAITAMIGAPIIIWVILRVKSLRMN